MPCRLYLVTPPQIDPAAFAVSLSAALDAGDVACVQLRLKDGDDDAVRRACEALLPETRKRDVALLINDRPDLALEMEADGVHVGQEDMSCEQARRIVGPDRIVGVTCHGSRHLAMEAAAAGADYAAFGAFYPSLTKNAPHRATTEILSWWRGISGIPSVAIGGITPENAADLVRAGADFLAVSSAVWEASAGPAAAVAAFGGALGGAVTAEAESAI